MQSLPDGWIRLMNASHKCLVFSSLSIDSFALLPITTFIVKIDCDLKWSLSYNGISVRNQQLTTFSDSQQIKCLNDVLILLTSIQASHICCGNPVEEFQQLLDDRGEKFKDSEGCSNSYNVCICVSSYSCMYHFRQAYCNYRLPKGYYLSQHLCNNLDNSRKSVRYEQCANFRRSLCVQSALIERSKQ